MPSRFDTRLEGRDARNDPAQGLSPLGDLHDEACLNQPQATA